MDSLLLLAPLVTVLWALSVRSYPKQMQKIDDFERRQVARIWYLFAGVSAVFMALCLVVSALYRSHVGALLVGLLCLVLDVALLRWFLKRDIARRR